MPYKIAVAGAGVYGSTAAIRLAEQGHQVSVFDPLGVVRAASAINAGRIHAGYHYPRSSETIVEVAEARGEFLRAFAPAIMTGVRNYYAIPRRGSRTSPEAYEAIMQRCGLALGPCRPAWLDFDLIHSCYEVEEQLYNPAVLRTLLETRIRSLGIALLQQTFTPAMRHEYDFAIWATYGLGSHRAPFPRFKRQVAEKILIRLPPRLRGLSVVLVDGPFTAFDAYGDSGFSLFGSAQHTNHWSSTDPDLPVPPQYSSLLNSPTFDPVACSHFEQMRADCCLAIPEAKHATYHGSRFTIRVVEDNPDQDRRILNISNTAPRDFHIFSGKVVSAVKAARLICEAVAHAA